MDKLNATPSLERAIDFAPHFVFSQACDSEGGSRRLLNAAFALRYQVYCLDRGFLPAEDYPDREERDEYDDHSMHFCALNLREEVVGTVRLVRPPFGMAFPFQDRCTELFVDSGLPAARDCAEISRLVVDRDYRRRNGDSQEGISIHATVDLDCPPVPGERRCNSPEIVLGLYRAMYTFSRRSGIEYWYAAMEKSLARRLASFHFAFCQIGPEVDYYGPVAPYIAQLSDLEDRLARSNPRLFRWFRE